DAILARQRAVRRSWYKRRHGGTGEGTMKGARNLAAWAAFAMLALGAREAAAQITGSIGGTIHDASGAVLPGATVTVRGPNLQKEAATAVSGASGTYRVALIPPGVYEAMVDLQGFAPQNRKHVEVAIHQQTTLDFVMAVGGRSEEHTSELQSR